MSKWRSSRSAAAAAVCAVFTLAGCESGGSDAAFCGPDAFTATQDAVTFCGFTGDGAHGPCPDGTLDVVDFVGLRVCTNSLVEPEDVPDRVCVDATGQACSALTLVVPGLYLGESCVPASIPDGGYGPNEIHLESPNVACGVDWCMSFRLQGDPNFTLEDGCDPDQAACPTDAEVEARLFCTCRCDGPEGDETCACSDGFVCETVPGAEQRGYCVREELVSPQ